MGEKRRPRVGSRWRSDWCGRVTEYVVEEHTPDGSWEYRLTGYRVGCAPFADACGLDAFQKWRPMSACPWESADGEAQEGQLLARKGTATGLSFSAPPPQAPEGPAARSGGTSRSDLNDALTAFCKARGLDGFQVGYESPGMIRVHLRGATMSDASAASSLIEGRLPLTVMAVVTVDPKPTKPKVRVGQVWRHSDCGDVVRVDHLSKTCAWQSDTSAGIVLEPDGTAHESWTIVRDVEEPAQALAAEADRRAWVDNDIWPNVPVKHDSETYAEYAERVAGPSVVVQSIYAALEVKPSQITDCPDDNRIVVDCASFEEADRVRQLARERLPVAPRVDTVGTTSTEVAGTRGNPAVTQAAPDPVIRPGQRYSDGRHEYAFLDEDSGTFLARRDDGLRVLVPRSRVVECAWELRGGPVEVETNREALERTVKLEAEYAPAGETAGTWLRKLVDVTERAGSDFYYWMSATSSCMVECGTASGVRKFARWKRGNLGPWNAMRLEEAGR